MQIMRWSSKATAATNIGSDTFNFNERDRCMYPHRRMDVLYVYGTTT